MGDVQVSFGGPNMVEERLFSPSLDHLHPDPSSISADSWAVAEETIQELMNCIHPTLDSEEKRKDVIEYVQRLIRCSLGCEVFPYGSVPLKTYLPDGDIDLTTVSSQSTEESLASDVIAVLQEEERNGNAEYEVKDTQFIDAEVKLVKCLVQNIVIDISFNQLGGLSTLCFLEQIDRLAGKNHLFKRSLLLIKAWCYYESRILGAHHGLISTYALETLVLYIFHVFHSSLNGPLQVLYWFLDYFYKFDWENYCISLNGPVCKSSLPDIVVEKPENDGCDLLLTEEFLRNSMDMFSVPSRGLDANSRAFPQKHLNIIDPLKEKNNLGRSVHRGNFYRIRSAFKYGARKLGRILLLPRERIADEIKKFFSNSLERHGRKYEICISSPLFCFEESDMSSFSSHRDAVSEDDFQLKSLCSFSDTENFGVEETTPVCQYDLDGCSVKPMSSLRSDTCYATDETSVSGYCLAGHANDLSNSRSLSSRNANNASDCSQLSSNNCSSLCGECYIAPFLYPASSLENENRNNRYNNASNFIDEKLGLDSWMENSVRFSITSNTVQSCISNAEGLSSSGSAISNADAHFSEGLSLDFRESDLTGISEDADCLNPLSDLSGDYDSHIRSLLCARDCNGYALGAPILPKRTMSPSLFQSNKPWDLGTQPLKQNLSSQNSTNGVVVKLPVFFANSIPSSTAFCMKEKHKAQGTGTYLPNVNSNSYWQRPSLGRGNQANHSQSKKLIHFSGVARALSRANSFEEFNQEVSHAHSPANGHGKSRSLCDSDASLCISTLASDFSEALCKLEFGSLGCLSKMGSPGTPKISDCSLPLEGHCSRPATIQKGRVVAKQFIHLKNETEFPPLSS